MNTVRSLTETGTQVSIVNQIVQKVLHNPKLSQQFFSLYDGSFHRGEVDPQLEGDNLSLDAFRVSDICSMNSFSAGPTKIEEREEPSALYIMPSYMNHSCKGNCARYFIGDLMVIRALRNIPNGTELTMSYVPPNDSYADRTRKMAKHNFVCDCDLCVVDRSEPVLSVQTRALAMKKFENEIRDKLRTNSISDVQAIQEIQKIVALMEKT
jgi:hypothetical protein